MAKYISIVKSAVKDYALSMAGHNELAVSFKRCIFALDEACIINRLLSYILKSLFKKKITICSFTVCWAANNGINMIYIK